MQQRIRESNADVPIVKRLTEMHEKGQGFAPDECAELIAEYIDRDDFGVEPTADAYALVEEKEKKAKQQ